MPASAPRYDERPSLVRRSWPAADRCWIGSTTRSCAALAVEQADVYGPARVEPIDRGRYPTSGCAAWPDWPSCARRKPPDPSGVTPSGGIAGRARPELAERADGGRRAFVEQTEALPQHRRCRSCRGASALPTRGVTLKRSDDAISIDDGRRTPRTSGHSAEIDPARTSATSFVRRTASSEPGRSGSGPACRCCAQ